VSSKEGTLTAPRHVLFDLDGTLTDSRPGIVNSIRYAIRRFNETTGAKLATPDPQSLNLMIGPPLRESFAGLAGEADADRLLAIYRERYEPQGIFENSVYPGIPAALDALAMLDCRLYVATSKPEVYARRIIDHFELARYFVAVHGAEPDGTRSDKSELIVHILGRHLIDPRFAAMIGDRRHDAIGARAAGVWAIGALWGYGSRGELSEAGADPLLGAPTEIPGAVERGFARRAASPLF
jgi:phosphoglycolate phosphatase